ncbi:aspartate kinase [Namhaeicola litoreus]|uniref:Aspartokinase n=1 Tax=Namhaeicola litoreus TaxID=1052145 RepID=A0ABW3XXG0_9FLAO
MKVLKFGGASVKNAEGVRNLASVIQKVGFMNGVIVISAMGKMTNAFEEIVKALFYEPEKIEEKVNFTRLFHQDILIDLFGHQNKFEKDLTLFYQQFSEKIELNKGMAYDRVYDEIVSQAEILSTKICSFWLDHIGINHQWLDAREVIKTDDNHRKAKVNWSLTQAAVSSQIKTSEITLVQGFIGSHNENITTTLGREGSDYTAAIIGYCLDAEEVNVFKDVPGVMNADPRVFERAVLLNELSFTEAIEMSFYGATVIHPKTIQPLQKKNIPLVVKSFVDPVLPGTRISKALMLEPRTPIFIRKENQILLSISDREFDFIAEEDLSDIYDLFHKHRISVNLIQLSAISFSVCFEDIFNTFQALIEDLQKKYKVLYNNNLILYTVRHFNEEVISDLLKGKEVLLKQTSRETVQILMK